MSFSGRKLRELPDAGERLVVLGFVENVRDPQLTEPSCVSNSDALAGSDRQNGTAERATSEDLLCLCVEHGKTN
jgi:hypothetical protein